jgi:YVTN family beta-propeller protein
MRNALLVLTLALPMLTGAADFRIQQRLPIGGDGNWDNLLIDRPAHLLYITRADRLQIVDLRTGLLTGEVTGLQGVHGVVLDAIGKYGYISEGAANRIAVFDRASRKVIATIPAGRKPDFILFEPTTARVFAFNGTSYDVTVIDSKTNQVVATFPIPSEPEGAVADGKGAIFLNIELTHQMVRIDAASATVTATWSLLPCERPVGLAWDGRHRRLFSACANKMMAVVDADTGKVVATPVVGEKTEGAAYDGARALVFTANRDATLSVIAQKSADAYEVVQTLPTVPATKTMIVDPDTGTVYIPAAQFGPRPAATPETPKPRAPMVPNSFVVLVVADGNL